MQTKKVEVEKKIYKGALEVFREKGYKGATMKEISEKAGVPIGNIYRYYQNKERLFDELVFEVYTRIKFIHNHEEIEKETPNFDEKPSVFLSRYIALATSKPSEFSILFDSSKGTKYDTLIEELVEIRWKKYENYLDEMSQEENKIIDKDFILILMKSAVKTIISISKKYSNNEKLLRYYLMKFDYFFRGGIRETGENIKFYTKD